MKFSNIHMIPVFCENQNDLGNMQNRWHKIADRIFVEPKYFRKGYGIFIMQEIERIFSDAKEIFLDTLVWNIRTNAFYQKPGYIEYKKDDEFIYYIKKINNCELLDD